MLVLSSSSAAILSSIEIGRNTYFPRIPHGEA